MRVVALFLALLVALIAGVVAGLLAAALGAAALVAFAWAGGAFAVIAGLGVTIALASTTPPAPPST